jgi:hypothetical protein
MPLRKRVIMKAVTRLAVVSAALVSIPAFGASAASAQVANLNFDGLPEGLIVTGLSSGSGIAGDPVAGSVAVVGDRTPVGDGSGNAAMVYDSACHGGGPSACSGGEDDKFKPMLGKVLTVAYSNRDKNGDGLADKPDTSGDGGELRFDFSGFGTGSVTVTSMDVLDVERGGWIRLYSRGALVATVRFGPTRNNGLATVSLGHPGIDRMDVVLTDSGVIDNIALAFPASGSRAPAVCGSLRLSARALVRGRRSVVWARVRDSRGVAVAGAKVVARGAGVRSSRVTNGNGLARFVVRPRRAGVLRFAVPNSSGCARRVVVRGVRTARPKPPPLVG